MTHDEATESSPLLGKTNSLLPDPGDAPYGTPPSTIGSNGHSIGGTKPVEDEECQPSKDREHQYEGMPEVRKKMKYIMPAISIGVSHLE